MGVLHPGDTLLAGTGSDVNNNSLVLRLKMGRATFLLTGDVETPAEEQLLSRGADLACTVLKVPHHGAGTSLSPGFLRETMPVFGVISVGRDNDFGHPADATIAKLVDAAVSVLRTDQVGCVEVTTDGRYYSVRAR